MKNSIEETYETYDQLFKKCDRIHNFSVVLYVLGQIQLFSLGFFTFSDILASGIKLYVCLALTVTSGVTIYYSHYTKKLAMSKITKFIDKDLK